MYPSGDEEQGKNHSVIYTDNSGRRFRFTGGTWTWRNHNPGNLRLGSKKSVVRRFQWIGTAGGFAVFPKVTEIRKVIHVKENRNNIYAFYVEGMGWLSKEKCIRLAREGKVDAVICTSKLGNTYLRSRPDDAISDNFCRMVVKDKQLEHL